MKLESGVPSLDLCKRLKELGVPQDEGLFYWVEHQPCDQFGPVGDKIISIWFGENLDNFTEHGNGLNEIEKTWAAPNVAELGEMLPDLIKTDRNKTRRPEFRWRCFRDQNGDIPANITVPSEYGSTEADARCAMLIYLLENKLITLGPRGD